MDVVLVFGKLGTHKSALWLAILQTQEVRCTQYYTGGQLGFKRTDWTKNKSEHWISCGVHVGEGLDRVSITSSQQ